MSTTRAIVISGWGLALAAAWAAPAGADYIVLKNGGEIRGELQRESGTSVSKPERIVIQTLSGTVVVVARDDVQSVTYRRKALEEYETERRAAADTVEAQWQLAEWCRAKSLNDQRAFHLQRVVELDPEHVAAHRGLGHSQHQGRWMTRDEMMTSRGYVKYKGRYVLPQELELLEQDQRETEIEKTWYKKVNLWHGWLTGDRADRRTESLRNLELIVDPQAVPALYRAFHGAPTEELRLMYVGILSRIEGDKPLGPLVFQSLQDPAADVRLASIRAVGQKDRSKAIPFYVRQLKNDLNVIVNHAGTALGEIGDDLVVPQLIDALVTRHSYRVTVRDPSMSMGFGTDGSMASPGGSIVPPDIAVMLLTGQLPYGVQVNQMGTPRQAVPTKQVVTQKDEQNVAVLTALQRLTGQNFAFDEAAWRAWYNLQKNGTRKKSTGKL